MRCFQFQSAVPGGNCDLLTYAGDVNSLGKTIHVIKQNTKASLVVSKEVGLDVKTKSKHMFISREQSAR